LERQEQQILVAAAVLAVEVSHHYRVGLLAVLA
jgi:hypothetical protein